MIFRNCLGVAGLLGELALGLGMLVGCGQRPYQAFAVEVAATPPPLDAPAAKSTSTRDAGSGLRAQHPQWDLNRAPASTLAQLPGMGRATLAAIVAGRPYRSKRELLRRNIVSAAQYAQWKDYLVVHRPGTKASD